MSATIMKITSRVVFVWNVCSSPGVYYLSLIFDFHTLFCHHKYNISQWMEHFLVFVEINNKFCPQLANSSVIPFDLHTFFHLSLTISLAHFSVMGLSHVHFLSSIFDVHLFCQQSLSCTFFSHRSFTFTLFCYQSWFSHFSVISLNLYTFLSSILTFTLFCHWSCIAFPLR